MLQFGLSDWNLFFIIYELGEICPWSSLRSIWLISVTWLKTSPALALAPTPGSSSLLVWVILVSMIIQLSHPWDDLSLIFMIWVHHLILKNKIIRPWVSSEIIMIIWFNFSHFDDLDDDHPQWSNEIDDQIKILRSWTPDLRSLSLKSWSLTMISDWND